MIIREIKDQDNKKMEQIIKRSLEQVGLDIPGTAYFDPQLGNLSAFYKDKSNANYWVAVTEEDEVIGGVGIGPFVGDSTVGELQKLYISPAHQGKGVSKELMRVALDFAKKHYVYCYLETSHVLEIANRLYSKFGFRELTEPIEGSEHGTMDTWYIKEL
ncbi:GNAT family N-acetyltransferase [Virgibacillus halodenitrificans]|nr:GNAT family N-acetyltransferase [Virgibacillus halodenitrificans]